MQRLHPICALLIAVAALACGTQPRTIKHYSKDGISFSHYSDWKITEDKPLDGEPDTRSIHLEGPDDTLVMFTCLLPTNSVTAADFAAALDQNRQQMKEDYTAGSIKPIDVTPAKSERTVGRVGSQACDGVIQRFSIKILGQDVPHESRIYMVKTARYDVFAVTQAADEDIPSATGAFNLILNSFVVAEK